MFSSLPATLTAHDWGSGEVTAVPGPLHAHIEGFGLLTQHKIPEEESREASNTGGPRGNCHGLVSQVSDVEAAQHWCPSGLFPVMDQVWPGLAWPLVTRYPPPMVLLDQQLHLFPELAGNLCCRLSEPLTPCPILTQLSTQP